MTRFLLRFLAEAPLCGIWCYVWHTFHHWRDSRPKRPEPSMVLYAWAMANHEQADGKYGHKGTFEECSYPACEGVRKDNGLES